MRRKSVIPKKFEVDSKVRGNKRKWVEKDKGTAFRSHINAAQKALDCEAKNNLKAKERSDSAVLATQKAREDADWYKNALLVSGIIVGTGGIVGLGYVASRLAITILKKAFGKKVVQKTVSATGRKVLKNKLEKNK